MGRIGNFAPSYEGCHTLNIRSLNPSKSFALNRKLSATLEVSKYWEFTENKNVLEKCRFLSTFIPHVRKIAFF